MYPRVMGVSRTPFCSGLSFSLFGPSRLATLDLSHHWLQFLFSTLPRSLR